MCERERVKFCVSLCEIERERERERDGLVGREIVVCRKIKENEGEKEKKRGM